MKEGRKEQRVFHICLWAEKNKPDRILIEASIEIKTKEFSQLKFTAFHTFISPRVDVANNYYQSLQNASVCRSLHQFPILFSLSLSHSLFVSSDWKNASCYKSSWSFTKLAHTDAKKRERKKIEREIY